MKKESYFEQFMDTLDKKEGKDSEGFTFEEMEKCWNQCVDVIFDLYLENKLTQILVLINHAYSEMQPYDKDFERNRKKDESF